MSSQSSSLEQRLVKCQMELNALKNTQIIGGDNMGCVEYNLLGSSYNLKRNEFRLFAIVIYANGSFPLCSIELEIFENGNKVVCPQGICPKDGEPQSSLVSWRFYQSTGLQSLFMGDVDLQSGGSVFSASDPRCYMYFVEASNGTQSDVTVAVKNVKIRSSHIAQCFCGWENVDWEMV